MVRFSCLENLLCQVEFLQTFGRQASGGFLTPSVSFSEARLLEPEN